jgi:thiosulfate reductase / polysulfide reductase chain A
MFHSARFTRRQLLKLGIMGAGATAFGGLASQAAMAQDLIRGGVSPSRTTGRSRLAVPSTCGLCTARCGILGFVEEDRLVKIEGNPRDPNSRGRLCARGQAGVNRMYDPDRVMFPMERAGRRGENQWVRLSWEQAYDKLEARLLDLQARDPEGLVLHTGLEGGGMLARRFMGAFGSRALIDETSLRGANREAANQLCMGTPGEVVDIANARYILNFGGNPYESHSLYVPFVQRLVDARMSGAKLVTFDPRLSLTAGRSDEWFPLLPGTDGFVVFAVANVILQQGLHDREFLSRWTDISLEELSGQLSAYTPEAAEAVSGVRADDIRRIATEVTRVRPAAVMFGGGVTHQRGAVSVQRATILLNALLGSVGVAGGYCPSPAMSLPEPAPQPPPTSPTVEMADHVDRVLRGERLAGVYITSLANPAYSWPDSQAFDEALRDEGRVQYLVAIDTNLTETAMLADLVLPAATYLESWGLEAPPPQDMVPYVTLRQPICRPLGESLSVDDILLTLGTRLGGDAPQFFAFPRLENYIDAVVSQIPEVSDAGGLGLLREQGAWYDLSAPSSHAVASGGFGTTSGRLELRSVAADAAPGNGGTSVLPGFDGPEGEEFALVTYRPNVHSGDYTANCWWLAEIAHDNALLVNSEVAKRKGLHQGQHVRLVSPVGELFVPVRITNGIHPKVVALATGFGHEGIGRIARSERFRSSDPMTMHVWWDKKGNGINVSRLVPGKTEKPGGGLVWMDTRVRIEATGNGRGT